MKRKEKQPLQDEEKLVLKERSAAIKDEMDLVIEEYEKRLLGSNPDSISLKTVSGGRPESNRSKF
ncbi:MAG TPA: hypothetical protein VKR60_04290 [Candidatus Sulfotelmatobacter sp.]|nr:hypothetical protein [Candidatus Sulfotelmatobacter sp.]